MRRITLTLAALALIGLACESVTGLWDGPVDLVIVDGDGQTVEAGRDSLLAPVVGRAVRAEGGRVSFVVGAAPLHAQQTGIQTGVPNVRTCATPAADHGLVPWLQCLDTDSEGFVSYWFDPPTVAGERCAEIRALIDGQPEVVATTCAEVEPGPLVNFRLREASGGVEAPVLDGGGAIWFPTMIFHDEYQNAIPYTVNMGENWTMEPHAAAVFAWQALYVGTPLALGDTLAVVLTARDEATVEAAGIVKADDTGSWYLHLTAEWPPVWH